jgi:hypothetical protein
MPMSLNGTVHMYTVTARLHWWIFMLDVPICLWGW